MDRRSEEIETEAPVGQPGEVAEGFPDSGTIVVSAVPDPDDDDGGEDIEGDERTQAREHSGRKQPRCFKSVEAVMVRIGAEESRTWNAAHDDGEAQRSVPT